MAPWLTWADLSLRRKGLFVVAIPVIAISLWFVVLILAARQGREAQQSRAHSLQVTSELEQALRHMVDAQSAISAFLVGRNTDWLAPYREAHAALPARITRLKGLVADDSVQLDGVSRLARDWAEWESAAARLIETPAAVGPAMTGPLSALLDKMQRLRGTIDAMQRREQDLLAERNRALIAATRRFAWFALGSLVIGLLGAFAGSWVYSKGVVRRIETVRRNADRLLTSEPFEPVPGRDEVGRLATQFEQAAAMLRERTAELEAFTYSVSHDLRAPLRHVAGFGELLRQRAGDQLDSESRRYIATIAASAERMGKLIDDLLALSRVGRAEIQRVRVSLPKVLEPVIDEQRAAASGRDLQFRIGDLPDVMGDPSLIRLALTNLVANAIKYTRPRAVATIEIGARTLPGDQVEVSVTDNGVGFDMSYVDRLFGVFQRLHRVDEFEGTGIGLAIVKRVAMRHGGSVRASGDLGRGATFSVSFPSAEVRG
ncbi:MAG: HAMP domain-containing protein [Acidobacteria bacterium]|nr:MAG: HAMP domain-containing protein [Acidobacteriota bacterium]